MNPSTANANAQYAWDASAEAFLSSSPTALGTFLETASQSATGPLGLINHAFFQGAVESPEPGKLYDNLPFLIVTPNGNIDEITFDESWVDASAGVDAFTSANGNKLAVEVQTRALADARSQAQPDNGQLWFQASTGVAEANAQMLLDLPFNVLQAPGEADGFDLKLDFRALVDAGDHTFSADVTNEFSISLENATTHDELFSISFNNKVGLPAAIPGQIVGLGATFTGLEFGHNYRLRLSSTSHADAQSRADLILIPSPNDPNVFIIDGVDYAFDTDNSFGNLRVELTAITRLAVATPEPESLPIYALALLLLGGMGVRRRSQSGGDA